MYTCKLICMNVHIYFQFYNSFSKFIHLYAYIGLNKQSQDEQIHVDEDLSHDNLGHENPRHGNLGDDSLGHDNSGHEAMEVGEGSRSVAQIGMDECIRLATSVKKNITHRNLDHLLTMDMDKLKLLADMRS